RAGSLAVRRRAPGFARVPFFPETGPHPPWAKPGLFHGRSASARSLPQSLGAGGAKYQTPRVRLKIWASGSKWVRTMPHYSSKRYIITDQGFTSRCGAGRRRRDDLGGGPGGPADQGGSLKPPRDEPGRRALLDFDRRADLGQLGLDRLGLL